ncbi:MAG: hypothetical protein KA444_03000 [Bacteroidia bacterium]|nr:hypothetical protein [Bacteroidia bacterium]
MENGHSRFIYYLDQLSKLLTQSKKFEDPALWLFKNKARTAFFMLEGLAIIYGGIQDQKVFDKLKDQFKLIEDGLGAIDHYSALSGIFEDNKQIEKEYKQYIKKSITQKSEQLNEILIEKDWLSDSGKRIQKITKNLEEIEWLSPKEEAEAFCKFYLESIDSINKFAIESEFHFDDIEEDVHELRRKIRWLSIYPQAMQGVFQFATDIETAPHLQKYMTEEILTSPFNQLPPKGENTTSILLNKNNFLALSWVISKLGNLKDEGLVLMGLSEAIKESIVCTKDQALTKALTVLGEKQRNLEDILEEAEKITEVFFGEEVLEHLIAGTTSE